MKPHQFKTLYIAETVQSKTHSLIIVPYDSTHVWTLTWDRTDLHPFTI